MLIKKGKGNKVAERDLRMVNLSSYFGIRNIASMACLL